MDEWTIKTSNPICRLFFQLTFLQTCGILFDRFSRLKIHSLMVCIFGPACELLHPWTKELYLCTVAPLLYLQNLQYKIVSASQTKMTSKDNIKGLVSLKFLRPWVLWSYFFIKLSFFIESVGYRCNIMPWIIDWIPRHQTNKRLESLAPCYSQSLLLTDFLLRFLKSLQKNLWNKETRVFSWIAFGRMEKWG